MTHRPGNPTRKRNRIDLEDELLALESFARIPVRLPSLALEPSVALPKRHDVYAYDAYVIDCARRYKTLLLTLDRRQSHVARSEGITVLEVDA